MFGLCVAMHALLHDAQATSHWLPQPTQEFTDFQRFTHEPWRSAQDKAAFTNTHFLQINHGIKNNGTRAAQERKLGQIDDIKRDWTEFNIGEGDDLETGWRTSRNKVPVGVFEADASLLQFVSILQFGHILSIDRRLGHGLLEEDRHGQTNEKEETPLLESDLSVSTASLTNYHHNSGG